MSPYFDAAYFNDYFDIAVAPSPVPEPTGGSPRREPELRRRPDELDEEDSFWLLVEG